MTENNKQIFDLEERTAKFAKLIIKICKEIPKTVVTLPIIDQLIRASTSVGANYREANGASSKKDFTSKISICLREIKESDYWLDMLKEVVTHELIPKAIKEANELIFIFSRIHSTCKNKV